MARIYGTYTSRTAYCVGLSNVVGRNVYDRYRSRSTVEKRVKPVGLELKFSPTAFTNTSSWGFDTPHVRNVELVCQQKKILLAEFVSYYDSVGYGAPTLQLGHNPSNTAMLLAIKAQAVNLGMVLAEYRETEKMFVQLATQLLDGFRAIKKGNFSNLPKWIKKGLRIRRPADLDRLLSAPMDTWMMYRYGITPLISDIFNMLSVVKGMETLPVYKTFRVRSSAFDQVVEERLYKGVLDRIVTSRKTVVRDVCTVEFDPGTLKNLSQIGLLNPVQLTYEVIPCSFVLDWFISLGDFLASLDALVGVKRYSFTRTTRSTMVMDWPHGPPGHWSTSARAIRSLTVSPPRWEPSKSWKKFVDSTILLRQVAQRKLFKV